MNKRISVNDFNESDFCGILLKIDGLSLSEVFEELKFEEKDNQSEFKKAIEEFKQKDELAIMELIREYPDYNELINAFHSLLNKKIDFIDFYGNGEYLYSIGKGLNQFIQE